MHSSPSPTNTHPHLLLPPILTHFHKLALTMAKLNTLIAFFAIAILVGSALAFHATIEIDEDDNQGRWPGSDRCRQMQGRQQLRSCERYLRQGGRRDDVLLMEGVDEDNQRGGEFNECCRQLRQVDEHCRCELLRDLAREEQHQGRRQEGGQMVQRARDLPARCGLRPQRCEF